MSSKTKASKIKHGKDILSLNIVAYTFTGYCGNPVSDSIYHDCFRILFLGGSDQQKRLQPSAAGFFLRGI